MTQKQMKDCTSGRKFENLVASLLEDSGWDVEPQFSAGTRLGKPGKHVVDILARKDGVEVLISCKYQRVPGTISDKGPYEYMSMLRAVEENLFEAGFLVFFGAEAIKTNMLTAARLPEFKNYMRISDKIVVCDFTEFAERLNSGNLLCLPK